MSTLDLPALPTDPPSTEAIAAAIQQFVVSVAAATASAAQDSQEANQLAWLAGGWSGALDTLDRDLKNLRVPAEVAGPNSVAGGMLLKELAFVCVLFRDLVREVYPDKSAPFTDNDAFAPWRAGTEDVAPVSTVSKEHLETSEVVVGSLGRVYNWLPDWVKKVLDTVGEGLKIIRILSPA
ncbi:MAG TPA: hypothetical protein PKG84_06855 [Novosphingobium sp.]|nr:hypothetical protein [Novosphingobium sp.]